MRFQWMVITALATTGCSVIFNVDGYDVARQRGDAGEPQVDAGPDSGEERDSSVADAAAFDSGSGGLADLTIACGSPPEITMAGDVVRVPWTVGNLGTALGGPLTVAVLMERSAMSAGEADEFIQIGTVRIPTRIAADGSENGEVAFAAPDWILGGENAIRCVVDSVDEVAEVDESNNTSDTFAVATALPNLTVTELTVPFDTAYGPLTYRFRIRNVGATAARDVTWHVYGFVDGVGGGALVDAAILFIAPAGSVVVDDTVFAGYEGTGEVRVFVDADDTIRESVESDNGAIQRVCWGGAEYPCI